MTADHELTGGPAASTDPLVTTDTDPTVPGRVPEFPAAEPVDLVAPAGDPAVSSDGYISCLLLHWRCR